MHTTGIEKARQLFEDAGFAFPAIPHDLASRLRELDNWLFSTRELKISPYDVQHYVEEAGSVSEDYAVLSHTGHGVNSYAIQYYLVSGPVRLFLHLGWGGVYMNGDAASPTIEQCFSVADEIVAAQMKPAKFIDGPLVIVGSDFYGSYWLAPGGDRESTKAGTKKRPLEVLHEARRWLVG